MRLTSFEGRWKMPPFWPNEQFFPIRRCGGRVTPTFTQWGLDLREKVFYPWKFKDTMTYLPDGKTAFYKFGWKKNIPFADCAGRQY